MYVLRACVYVVICLYTTNKYFPKNESFSY